MELIFKIALISLLPVSELRGAIPFGYFNGMSIYFTYLIAVFFNSLISIILFIFLNSLNKLLLKMKWYKKIFERFVERSRKKVKEKFEKYEYIGLMIFVAIPLPVTGAWTGALGAWALGLEFKKSVIYITLGVLISGIIVSIITVSGGILIK